MGCVTPRSLSAPLLRFCASRLLRFCAPSALLRFSASPLDTRAATQIPLQWNSGKKQIHIPYFLNHHHVHSQRSMFVSLRLRALRFFLRPAHPNEILSPTRHTMPVQACNENKMVWRYPFPELKETKWTLPFPYFSGVRGVVLHLATHTPGHVYSMAPVFAWRMTSSMDISSAWSWRKGRFWEEQMGSRASRSSSSLRVE